MATGAVPLSSQSMLMAQAGIEGKNRAGGKLLRPRHCLLLSSHSFHFPAEPGWPGAEQRPRSSWKEVDNGTEHQGKGPSAQRGREPSPPSTVPH